MRFVALAGSDGERGRVAWGSEADALEDVELSQFVLDFIIVLFCANVVGAAPTIWAGHLMGGPSSFGTNLRRTPLTPIVAPAPFGRCKWGRPLLTVPSSEPTQAYTDSCSTHPGPPKLGTKIGGAAY